VCSSDLAFIINIFLSFGIWNLVLGAFVGAGFFGLQYLVSRGKWIGLGDVKFGALIGVMFGAQMTLLIIVLAYIIGGILAVILLISRQKKFGEVLPMGTFLALSGIIVLFFGQQIMGYYLNLLGT
jgi:prepilin signal peptidase PulO-like enzyme (type II secretory pathway)